MQSTQLKERLNARQICERRDQIIGLITSALEKLGEADQLLETITHRGLSFDRSTICSPSSVNHRSESIKKLTKQTDQKLWRHIVELGQFQDLMSVKQQRIIDEQLEQCPPLTYESVTATFGDLLNNRPNMLQDLVETAFLERSSGYKSNKGMKIGRKHVLHRVYNKFGFSNYGYASDRLRDITKAIAVLEGVEAPHVVNILSSQHEFEWLSHRVVFKSFQNGNVHVQIHDQTIVDELNDVLAGAMGAKVGDSN